MKVKFCVITRVPKLFEEGNMAHDLLYRGYDYMNKESITIAGTQDNNEKPKHEPIGMCLRQVFEKGELLVLDADTEREIGYPCRKPCKWQVEYKLFDKLQKAIELCEELMR